MQPVVFNANLQEALNLIGTFVFAISGALLAVHKRYDIVGMTVLAEITAIGGGVIRDLILGAVPPAAFTDHVTFLIPLGAVALVFFVYRYVIQSQGPDHDQDREEDQNQHGSPGSGRDADQDQNPPAFARRSRSRIPTSFVRRYRSQLQYAVLVSDAAGLAVFCVSGAAKALAHGLGPVEATALGALTGVGGGILRDVLANEQPAVLRADSELYAVPAVLGAAIVVAVQDLHLQSFGTLAATLAAVFVFVLRLGALRYGWQAPQPNRGNDGRDDG